jgi:hypothetical protein
VLCKAAQITLELLQLADTRPDIRPAALEQLEHVSTRGCPCVTNADDVADFRDGQTNGLGRADECQARNDITVVSTVARRCAVDVPRRATTQGRADLLRAACPRRPAERRSSLGGLEQARE